MRLASMIHRFVLQRPEGTSAEGYDDVARVSGALTWAGGAEPIAQGTPIAVGQHAISIWHRTDVRAEWRLVEVEPVTGRVFQILDYGDRDGQQRVLELLCTEVH